MPPGEGGMPISTPCTLQLRKLITYFCTVAHMGIAISPPTHLAEWLPPDFSRKIIN